MSSEDTKSYPVISLIFFLPLRSFSLQWNIKENCVCLLHNLSYRVTHKGWDFRDDCTEFCFVFLHYGIFIAVGQNWLTTVLNYPISQQNTELNTETENPASNCHIFYFWVVFTVLCFVGNPICRLKNTVVNQTCQFF